MSRLLIYPPFADPTQPYLSLPTLKGHLRSKGLDARVLDLNIEAVHHLLGSEELEALARKIGRRFVELNRRKELSFDAEREYVALADARAGIGDLLAAEPPPIDVFRTREHFFDAPLYTQARRRMEAFFQALGAAHFPYRYGFNRAGHEVLPWSFDLLEEYCAEARSPLDRFYRKVLDPLPDWDPAEEGIGGIFLDDLEFAGISIVFPSQVPEALYLARFLRAHAPGAFVALGGPCLHQIAHGMDPGRLRRLLGFADGLCLFEGEETLVRLFPLLPAWRDASEPTARSAILSDVPNLLLADPASGETRLGPRSAVDLETAAPPDWSDLDLDRYLAPSRILLFAPTRGCYWNRCSFCRYGLSETATAAYREVPPERSAAQIAKLSKRHGVRNFYISCDVLSPSYALRFAQALIDRGLKIRWSSDLKPEKYFTPERCEVLQRSGLRSAAFGVESGSDRVLGLIAKGNDVASVTAMNRAFHEAGVATQWMAFTGHPGETSEEALETVRWIGGQQLLVDIFIVGEFSLELGSRIALDPARYGVDRIFHAAGDDLRLYALFTRREGEWPRADRRRVEEAIGEIAGPYALRPYPWAGAVSTHHTFLHFLEFGQRAFKTHFQEAQAAGPDPDPAAASKPGPLAAGIPGLREKPLFDVGAARQRIEGFFETYLRRALASGEDGKAPLCREHFRSACAAVTAAGTRMG